MEDPSPIPTERAIFERAMELPEGADLAEFLSRSCAGDPGLAGRVAALVESSQASADLLPDDPSGWLSGGEAPGELIGNYRLEEIVGQGAFGTVWLARQLQPVQRRVALKIIKLGLDTLAVISRFEVERQALAVMDHPNIANVHDAGATATGRPFFVMDYLDGEPLFAYADSRRLTIAQRLDLMQQVVAAVQHAHQKGIIHRDLKSSNILVVEIDGEPVPKVIDFGIAKLISPTPDADLTLMPGSWGTPAYMSPEQLAGDPIDTRSDIFSLGIILYQLLSGSVAKRGKSGGCPDLAPSRALMQLAQNRQLELAAARSTSPRDLAKALKGELDWIVLRAAADEPEQRYSSAGALSEDLALFRAGRPVAAGPPTKRYVVGKFIRRYRGRLAIAVLALCAMFAATVVSLVYARQAQTASLAMEDALYKAHLSEAIAVRQSGRMGQRTLSLAAIATAAKIHPTPALRDEAIAAMALPDVELIGTLDAIPETQAVYAYDFVSDLLVTGRSDRREVQRYRVETGEQLDPVPLPDQPVGSAKLCISPGAAIIAVYGKPTVGGRGFYLTFYETATGREICSFAGANYQSHGCVFFDSAQKALVPMAGGGLAEIDLETGEELRRIETSGIVSHVSINATETKILASMRSLKKIQFIDAVSGATIKTISPPGNPVEAVLSPGGRLLAYGGDSGVAMCQSLAKVDAGRLSPAIELGAHRSLINKIHFVLGGSYLITSSWDRTVRLWSPTGSQLLMLEGAAVFASPDGKRLLIQQGKRVRLFRMVPAGEVTTFSQPAPTTSPHLAFSSDSSLVAICSEEGTMLASLPGADVLASFGTRHRTASFDPDGETLVTAGEDGLRAWDLNSLRAGPSAISRHVISEHSTVLDPSPWALIARSSDNTELAATSLHVKGGIKKRIRVSELATGATVASFPWKGADLTSLQFDPQGRWIAGSYWRGKGITVWDSEKWQPVANLAPEVASMSLSVNNDGSLLASGSPAEICLWDTSTWQCVRRFPSEIGSSFAKPVNFSPDGSILAYGYDSTRLRLVRVSDGTEIATLTLPTLDHVMRLQFSPDQRFLGVSGQERSFIFDLEAIGKHLNLIGLGMEMP